MTRKVMVGNLYIGGDAKITVQSMCNTPTEDVSQTVAQILALENAGCDIVRVSVPTERAAKAVGDIVKEIHIPLVADIHFDYKLALAAAENGAAKIRLNPGNIGSADKVKYVADFLNERQIPIRIGVNEGSLEKEFNHLPRVEALVQSALKHVGILEKANFYNTIVSIKSSSVQNTVLANRMLSSLTDYPLHLGVTEAGGTRRGLIKNAAGLSPLLLDGIGNTIRISLADNPVEEVYAGRVLLKSLRLGTGVEIIACPTCARTAIPVAEYAERLEKLTASVRKDLKIAVMGCVVNGVGEAGDADFGVIGGKDKSAIYRRGRLIETVDNERIFDSLLKLLKEEINEQV